MTRKTIEEEIVDMEVLAIASQPLRCMLLEEAASLTAGDRNRTYGEPVENMQHIADIFNARTRRKGEAALSARDVAILHQCTKQARRDTSPRHRDSYVDDMAYAGIEYECAMAERKG